MSLTASITSLQVGRARPVTPSDSAEVPSRPWVTGFGKQSTEAVLTLRETGLTGDEQADQRHHGGPDKAVCVYSACHFSHWQKNLQQDISSGAFGENFTIDCWTEADVCIGDLWQVGSAVVQVSQPRQPCWKLSRWWGIKDLAARVQWTGRTGWYLRTLQEGDVRQGDRIERIDRLHPQWTIEAANRVMHHDRKNLSAAESLRTVPELSASWQETLLRRIQGQTDNAASLRLQDGE